ncbi:oligosaccharide flippase family protein [Candidatus Hakubella thermalkaliphila]|uniref:oligosaccharide flippase family protein n=1 Tax=Candidatus Hakubella thermalkaliphila TaxID=2754717 RepID=UPI002158EE6A|nr:oligosaccharide flippase family protein [Candidatus Hakubella thermalkaliphila]
MGVWSLVIQRATFNLVLFIGCWLVSPWKLSLRKIRLNRGAATWFLREQGVYLWVVGLMGYVVLSFDDFLVGTLVGVTALGFYSMAYNISKMPLGYLTGRTYFCFLFG